ncbi:MAG: hypothetical protein HOE64_00025 [Nitrospina sp.]|nr:hypothetical protein [Candidatus Neomarinimicrobiota bacterium]MBT4046718.1 hypothetical protein [Nitrospina sp.]
MLVGSWVDRYPKNCAVIRFGNRLKSGYLVGDFGEEKAFFLGVDSVCA